MSTPPADPGKTPPPSSGTDPEASRVKSLDDRFNKIETEQSEQRGILQDILGKVSGTASPPPSGKAGGAPSEGQGAAAPPADIGEIMRQAVRDVGAENAAAAARERHDAEHERIAAQRSAEHAPRERRTPLRARLQRRMWGIDEQTLGGRPGGPR